MFVVSSIKSFLELNEHNSWHIFKLARMCVRYSYYEVANSLYEKMCLQMSSMECEAYTSDLSCKSWLEFMAILCKAEHLITQSGVLDINELIRNLNEALSLYMRAQFLFKSYCTRCLTQLENSNTCFQMRYCELRSDQIKLYIHLILSTMTYQTIPAPVFHFKSSENFGKFGRIAQQMKYSLVELQKLNQKYKQLISECFDADHHTLNILNM